MYWNKRVLFFSVNYPNYLLLTERGKAWLKGFRPEHQDTARWLVDGLTLVSLSHFAHRIDQMVRNVTQGTDTPVALFGAREIDQNRSYFRQAMAVPRMRTRARSTDAVGRGSDVGSEGHVASIIRNIARSSPTKFINHPTIAEMRNKKCRALIVVDDLVGSGKRTREFLDSIWIDRTIRSWWSLGYFRFSVIAFAGVPAGLNRIKQAKYRPSVFVDRDCPTYTELPWSLEKRRAITKLCESYASKTSKPRMALGYRKTMVSLVFEHGCPNNAPAILWAPSARQTRWQPLFPNRSVTQEEQSIFPPEVASHDLFSVLSDAGQPRLAEAVLPKSRRARS